MAGARTIRSFLIINPFGIGDCLFATPLISLVHRAYPRAKIFFLCNKKCFPIMSSHPLIEKAFIYERDEFVAAWKASFSGWLKKSFSFINDMRRERIDVCLDLSLNTQYGFYAWCAGIRRRFGLDYRNRCFFLNRKIRIQGFDDKHVADYYASVAAFVNVTPVQLPMSIGISETDRAWAASWIQDNGLAGSRQIIGIAPCGGDTFGANVNVRRWPGDQYALLIRQLRQRYNAVVLIFAGPKEKNDVNAIVSNLGDTDGVFDLSSTTLGQTIALIQYCSLFIGNDTGALRFADALQKKLVAFYGPADDIVYGPYPPDAGRSIVLKNDCACRPCYRRFRMPLCAHDRICLTGISVETAMRAVESLLST